jgi:hypothetical protein
MDGWIDRQMIRQNERSIKMEKEIKVYTTEVGKRNKHKYKGRNEERRKRIQDEHVQYYYEVSVPVLFFVICNYLDTKSNASGSATETSITCY